MKSFVCAVVVFAAVHLSSAQDDGQYRPELYGGDDGKYRPSGDGQYFASDDGQYRSGRYNAIASGFQQPLFIQPVNAYQIFGDQNGLDPYATYASSLSSVSASASASAQAARNLRPSSQSSDRYAKILRQDQDQDLNAYHYLYQTENRINAEEAGRIESQTSGTKATGYFEYIGDDGVKYRVDYVADENGFQPRGAHLPQAN